MNRDIEFKEFADILKTNISPESGDGSFLTEMIDAYLREPTAQDLQKLKDEAQKKSRKRKTKVAPESWNPFSDLQEDTLERIYRGSNPWDPKKLSKVMGRRSDTHFADWINKQPKSVLAHIEEDFENLCPGFAGDALIGFACQDWLTDFFQKGIDRDRPAPSAPLPAPPATSPSPAGDDSSAAPHKMTSEQFLKSFYIDSENGKLHFGNSVIKIPEELLPPDEIEDEEEVYIAALLAAYSEATGTPVTKDDVHLLKKKYRENFEEQRINYYAAVRITRIIRDCFINDEEELRKWLDESSDYISDTRRDDYHDGFERLKAVLKMVINCKTTSAIDQCGRLVGPKEKKGVCHLLANTGKIVWVNQDDE